MLLTKEGDYGARIIRTLASGEKKAVAVICENEHIPIPFAYKILKKMEHAGLLKGIRGRNGGYKLIKTLGEITLYDVMTAVDETIFIFECLSDRKYCPLNRADSPCAVHLELDRLQNLLIAEMQKKTMRELLQIDG
jgi:Rrf2 family protein